MSRPCAAIVTVGTELVTGVHPDANGATVAAALTATGHDVTAIISVPDDRSSVSRALRALIETSDLVVVTGGLGPTHDDITREAAANALGVELRRDPHAAERLSARATCHRDPRAAESTLRQADVLEGARVLEPESGTAPGQVVPTPRGALVLLPGPPHELGPMLTGFLSDRQPANALVRLRCAGITESEVQHRLLDALSPFPGVSLTILGTPGELEIVVRDDGAGARALAEAADALAATVGDACYSRDGASLAAVVIARARERGRSIAAAESCSGGLIAAALTAIPGASEVFRGAIVAYADDAKTSLLGVSRDTLASSGAVSERTAAAMADGARAALEADLAVAVTGIAGPGGGSAEKPVGHVCFALASATTTDAHVRRLFGDRDGVRARACVHALDMLRRALEE